ncbi:hypothetical protein SAMN05444339_101131 [Loktanella atrilutea]|uniref:Uncharacterized protein n=1 Tax=Loktanella atrilutea TaxID=366533 RepID=A0A1M4ST48_LOKAT|nr:hypothetical protein SAMN05444339_101131 [Loktanella atrilutea]
MTFIRPDKRLPEAPTIASGTPSSLFSKYSRRRLPWLIQPTPA